MTCKIIDWKNRIDIYNHFINRVNVQRTQPKNGKNVFFPSKVRM